MTWFDYLIIAVIAISALISLWRGFIREAFSLIVWVLAFWVALTFFHLLATYLVGLVETPSLRLGLAFGLLLLATLLVGGLVNLLVVQLIQKTGLSGTDRVIGVVFGIARGVLLICILVWAAGLTPLPNDPWWKESQLVPYFQELALWLRDQLPADIADRFRYAASSGMAVVWWG
jgi:membrane protein required for colicin V production